MSLEWISFTRAARSHKSELVAMSEMRALNPHLGPSAWQR